MSGAAMTRAQPDSTSAAARLMSALARLLGNSMGGGRSFPAPRPIARPALRALGMLGAYALIVAAAEAATAALGLPREPKLLALYAWAGGYGVARAFLAEVTTAQVFATVERDIIPHASPDYLEAVAAELERRDGVVRRILWPVLVAATASALTYWVLKKEMSTENFFQSPQWLFGAIVFSLSFVVSVRSVGAGRFPLAFAKCLEQEHDSLYLLGAADSPLVEGLAKLGRHILAFWVAVFLIVLTIMLLALPQLGPYALRADSPLLMILVPIMVFLTLGVGSIVYLRSEARIRQTLRRFTLRRAAILQRRINVLLDSAPARMPEDRDELEHLADWHDRILAGGRYGSPAGTAVSIALPFLLPAISLIKSLYDSLP